MDKGLIKTQELELELEKLNEELNQIETTIEIKKTNQNLTEERIEYLERNKKFAKSKMKKYIDIEQNIEKWKNKTIIKTIIILSSILAIIFIMNTMINISLIPNIILIVLGLKASYSQGESNNYYLNKKYLKEHSLEEFVKEINEYKRQLRSTYLKKYNIQTEITELNNKENDIIKSINSLNDKMESIKNLRTNIINEYIENNNELEELLNKGYESEKTMTLK